MRPPRRRRLMIRGDNRRILVGEKDSWRALTCSNVRPPVVIKLITLEHSPKDVPSLDRVARTYAPMIALRLNRCALHCGGDRTARPRITPAEEAVRRVRRACCPDRPVPQIVTLAVRVSAGRPTIDSGSTIDGQLMGRCCGIPSVLNRKVLDPAHGLPLTHLGFGLAKAMHGARQ